MECFTTVVVACRFYCACVFFNRDYELNRSKTFQKIQINDRTQRIIICSQFWLAFVPINPCLKTRMQERCELCFIASYRRSPRIFGQHHRKWSPHLELSLIGPFKEKKTVVSRSKIAPEYYSTLQLPLILFFAFVEDLLALVFLSVYDQYFPPSWNFSLGATPSLHPRLNGTRSKPGSLGEGRERLTAQRLIGACRNPVWLVNKNSLPAENIHYWTKLFCRHSNIHLGAFNPLSPGVLFFWKNFRTFKLISSIGELYCRHTKENLLT